MNLELFSSIKVQFANPDISDNYDLKLINVWLNEYRSSKMTHKLYRSIIFRFFLWLQANNLTIKSLDRKHILLYYSFISRPDTAWFGKCNCYRNHGWRPFNKVLSSSSINLNMRVIKSLMTYLYNSQLLLKNPFHYPLLHKSTTLTTYQKNNCLSSQEIMIINDYISNLREDNHYQIEYKLKINLLFNLLLTTGCRRTELAALTMSSIKFSRNCIWLHVLGKGNKQGAVPVLNSTIVLIDKYRTFYKLPDIFRRKNIEDHIPLLIMRKRNDNYEPVTSEWIYQIIKCVCKKISKQIQDKELAERFLKMSPHWFRHTYATKQIESGIDIRVVQQNLRHSYIQTTLIYLHDTDDKRYLETVSKFGLNT